MATDLARRMVTEWGMSEKLGFLAYDPNEQEVFLGRSVSQQKNVSDKTASLVDEEIRSIADGVYSDAKKLLKKYSKQLKIVAEALLEYETLTGDEIKDLIKGIKPSRDDFDSNPSTPAQTPKTSVPKTGGTSATTA